ncbi:hypothetical protein Patl1_03333 [Pistacia atlantica]|uniref:Uncharacterized protein n=1 Tax=Pistacia atlantica TaxID=434234 RepID=A0ACC1C7L9_9ROSI|nr:hypothetical protein Patl1_03333 [Pistacia atlantica]
MSWTRRRPPILYSFPRPTFLLSLHVGQWDS